MKEFWIVSGSASGSALGLAAKCAELAAQKQLSPKLILIRDTRLENEKSAVQALKKLWLERQPEAIIFECTQFFGNVAPAFASAIGRGITADCTKLEWDDGFGLMQIRPTYGGRKIAVNRSIDKPYIATVRQGTFTAEDFVLSSSGIEVIEPELLPDDGSICLMDYISRISADNSLEASEVILSGGLGLGSRENYERLAKLAQLMGAGLGASRAAVAAGYADYSHQVGQTGTTVHPRLYIAFGISGAVQHLSGITGAEKIIAVNSDPSAPIHEFSNYSIIADCREVIERLISRFEE